MFFKTTPESCDGRPEDTAMVPTSHATTLQKLCISSDLVKLTREFSDDISTTDSEDNFYSPDFSMQSEMALNQPGT